MTLHSSRLEWTKIDKISTAALIDGHLAHQLAQSTTTYRLLAGGNLATNAASFLSAKLAMLFWPACEDQIIED